MPQASKSKKCAKCNLEFTSKYTFCTDCGRELDVLLITCPNCGENIENKKYCPGCGTKSDNSNILKDLDIEVSANDSVFKTNFLKILSKYGVVIGLIELLFCIIGLIGASGENGSAGSFFVWALLLPILLVAIYVYFIPTIIAHNRGHAYKNIIFVINLAGVVFFIPWLVALGWAVFPSEKSLIDPIVGNPTGTGRRNAGDTVGAASVGIGRGGDSESKTDELIDNLIDLRTRGLIDDSEFKRRKLQILQRDN